MSPLSNGTTEFPPDNDTLNFHSDTEDAAYCSVQYIIYTPASKVIFSLLYLVIFGFGFFGNLLVSLAVIKSKHMRTVTNYFILNLALSDIVMCLFSVPFTPLQSFSGQWMFGEFLCKLFPFSQGVSVYISTLTLTIIALDRFVIIIYPFRARMQVKTCLLLVWIIDMLACLFTAPYAYHVTIRLDETSGNEQCSETWVGMRRTIYGAFTNITQFVLPFITIILCYTAIIRKLSLRSSTRPGMRSAHREELERARNLKTNRMLISMVVVFGICWLPLNCINLLADLEFFPIFCWEYYHLVFFICHVMAMSSTCYNPFLYGWHNESFQKEFIQLLPILRGVCGSPSSPPTNGISLRSHPIMVDNETTNGDVLNDTLISRMTSSVRKVTISRESTKRRSRNKMKKRSTMSRPTHLSMEPPSVASGGEKSSSEHEVPPSCPNPSPMIDSSSCPTVNRLASICEATKESRASTSTMAQNGNSLVPNHGENSNPQAV
eukprot:snap_masked-scaffold561_size136864-processed-gene-0.3 protein:Tk09521 transcript:snap_masked-scaffold561_size136864-processed-gene-0.3-mRNA-1 annotation:"neuropeptide receptor a10"